MLSMNTSLGLLRNDAVVPDNPIDEPAAVEALTDHTAVAHTVFGGKAKDIHFAAFTKKQLCST